MGLYDSSASLKENYFVPDRLDIEYYQILKCFPSFLMVVGFHKLPYFGNKYCLVHKDSSMAELEMFALRRYDSMAILNF